MGGAPGVDLVIEDPAVSRLHAELELSDSGLWVRDLESRNGTFVQGVRVSRACIPDGGQLRVGGTDLTVSYAPEPTPVEIWPEPRFGPDGGHQRRRCASCSPGWRGWRGRRRRC